jgi:hypothetical protein
MLRPHDFALPAGGASMATPGSYRGQRMSPEGPSVEILMIHLPSIGEQRGMGAMLHWILPRLAAYVTLMWPKPVVPFGQMGP